jgi:hypothetical protein
MLKKSLRSRLLIGKTYISNGHWAVKKESLTNAAFFENTAVAQVWAGPKVEVTELTLDNEKFLTDHQPSNGRLHFEATPVTLKLGKTNARLFVSLGTTIHLVAIDQIYVNQFDVTSVTAEELPKNTSHRAIAGQLETPDGTLLMSMRVDRSDAQWIKTIADCFSGVKAYQAPIPSDVAKVATSTSPPTQISVAL